MSQQANALCVLAVDEIFGELASRVFEALATSGRLTLGGILATSRLAPKEVKHGVATLIQHGLVLWFSSPIDGTHYEANLDAAYRLLQLGKYTQLVEDRFGSRASEIFCDLVLSGNIYVEDLARKSLVDGHSASDEKCLNGSSTQNEAGAELRSKEEMEDTIAKLVNHRVLMPCPIAFLRPKHDNRKEAEKIVKGKTGFLEGSKGTSKQEHEHLVNELLKKWDLVDDNSRRESEIELVSALSSSTRKRARDPMEDEAESPKKKVRFSGSSKLANGDHNMVHGGNGMNGKPLETQSQDGTIRYRVKNGSVLESLVENGHAEHPADSKYTTENSPKEGKAVRVDFDHLGVMARNETFVRNAEVSIGTQAARVYSQLLRLVENDANLPSRGISSEDAEANSPWKRKESRAVTLNELVKKMDNLGELELHAGSTKSKLESSETSLQPARAVRNRKQGKASDSQTVSSEQLISDEEHWSSSEDEDVVTRRSRKSEETGQSGEGLSTFAQQKETLHRHLIMLSDHGMPFLTHHARSPGMAESWTVPYEALTSAVRVKALFGSVRHQYDPVGLIDDSGDLASNSKSERLVRMLHQHGKLDDKAIAALSMLNPKELRARLEAMHKGGVVGVQELPRDVNRNVNRMLFMWFFDEHRCAEKFTEDTYQSMTRLLERLRYERGLRRLLLEKADRSDVRGSEAEWLSHDEFVELGHWRAFEKRVWSQIARLDDFVSLLRDY